MKVHNFNAGPSILPKEVVIKSAQSVMDFNDTGLSLLEISHRSADFLEIIEKSTFLVKRITNLNDDYAILFIQGGATLQFSMVPYNLMNKKAAYLDTGFWAYNAIKEAEKFGKVRISFSGKNENYTYISKNYRIPYDMDYFHCTSNNTIVGTQMKIFPKTSIPIVCDMSSDIFSRQLDFCQFSLIYASAQKNVSPAGMTIVIIKKDILGKFKRNIPSYMDYRIHIQNNSILNTPNVFSIYTSMLTLEWIENQGGLSILEKKNQHKAKLLYDEIDQNNLFENKIHKENRSNMNVSFFLKNKNLEKEFNKMWKKENIIGLDGHRYLGGYRASIYNALPLESVLFLIEIMKEFERKFS
ncbi:Phosphoserine aminotransferase [Blattabacterium sp. (Nauphoeta cinerea)]|uniref:3-phosphoserine/phosphohydroxythreonine transaminase n=1 Tax=Blattabacterium sp. (Nauphoeta cinerea) TaxID=1316444 RepID=UPI0003B00591|nr:3-phosphoserine/phosphohydroxythreonine transaminase [Blattabacterium sp. (Nauphoeta cinerea)]AGW86181.1 Phosphoserine aminotransferase [Blattabacterium sp. (Nauphoeta cinerea)]